VAAGDGSPREFPFDVELFGLEAAPPAVGRPWVTHGRWLAAGAANELVVHPNLLRFLGVEIGDEVTIEGPAGTAATFHVVGAALQSGSTSDAIAWVLPAGLDRLDPGAAGRGALYGVRLADPGDSRVFGETALALFPSGAIESGVDWQDVRADLTAQNEVPIVVLSVFSAFALVAGGFVIANAIGGRVLAQYRDIGLLKAIGLTPAGVTLLFLVEHLALGAVAGAIGLALGTALTPIFRQDIADILATIPVATVDPLRYLSVFVLVELAVAGFTLVPAWRGGRIPPVQAIAMGFARVQSRPSLPARLASWLHLPVAVVLGLKDVFARPVRAGLTVAALALTVVTVTFTLGMQATISDIVAHPERWGEPYDLVAGAEGLSAAELERVVAEDPLVASYFTRTSVAATVAGRTTEIATYALGGEPESWGYRVVEGRMLAAPGEAIVGQGLLDLLGLEIGDPLRLQVDGQSLDLVIVGRYVESDDSGRIAMYSLETFRQQVDPAAEPGGFAINLVPGTDPIDFSVSLRRNPAIGGMWTEVPDTGTSDELLLIRIVLAGLNVVLLVIGVVNLLTTTLLGVRESIRDFGILKTLGLTPGQTIWSVASGMGTLAALAVLVGIPAGLVATSILFDELGRRLGVGAGLGIMPSPGAVALVVPATILLALAGSVVPARLAARISVANALRYE
jgi:putative ABC transport system permease protein